MCVCEGCERDFELVLWNVEFFRDIIVVFGRGFGGFYGVVIWGFGRFVDLVMVMYLMRVFCSVWVCVFFGGFMFLFVLIILRIVVWFEGYLRVV